jgi:hypothetical protein
MRAIIDDFLPLGFIPFSAIHNRQALGIKDSGLGDSLRTI